MEKEKPSKSHSLLARYLNGDKNVSLDDIEAAELEDLTEYYTDKYSFNRPFLKKPLRFLFKMIFNSCGY